MQTETMMRRDGASDDAVAWVTSKDSLRAAWWDCDRGDWMLRIVRAMGADAGTLRRIACDIADSVVDLVPTAQRSVLCAVSTARSYAYGDADVAELDAARLHALGVLSGTARGMYTLAQREAIGAAYHAAQRNSVAAASGALRSASNARAAAVETEDDADAAWLEVQRLAADIVRDHTLGLVYPG